MAQETAAGTGSAYQSIRDLLVDPRELSLSRKLGLVGLVLMALVPVPITDVQLAGLTIIVYYMMFAMSWDFVSGYTGQISFGHTLFFTAGGYTSALLNLEYNITPIIGVPVGIILAAVAGLLIGVPALRVRGPYLALVTLIAPLILLQLFVIYDETFGGRDGLSPPDPLFGTSQDAVVTVGSFTTATIATYYVSFLAFLLMLVVMLAITRTDTGAVFTAIREDEDVVASVGLDPAKFKIFAFVFSAAAGGLAGGLFVHTAGDPLPAQLLTLDIALRVVIISIIGGISTIVGPVIGAIFYFGVNGAFEFIPWTIPIIEKTPEQLTPVPLYVAAMLVLYYAPEGIYGWAIRRIHRLSGEMEAAEADGESTIERFVNKYKERL